MANYVGVRCPVCNKKFGQTDDIVVCPVCGAPHHRGCYAEQGECAFVEGHLGGNVWRAPQEERQEQEGEHKKCPRCGADNPRDNLFCQVCGTSMAASPPGEAQNASQAQAGQGYPGFPPQSVQQIFTDPLYAVYGGVNPEETMDEESVRDIAQFIGPSSAYFLPRFKRMNVLGKTLSFHPATFLLSIFGSFFTLVLGSSLYYFYRKMHGVGALLLALFLVSMAPNFLWLWEVMPDLPAIVNDMTGVQFDETVWPDFEREVDQDRATHFLGIAQMTRMIYLVIGVVFSFCTNWLYYKKVIKSVRRMRLQRGERQQGGDAPYMNALAQSGGVSVLSPILIVLAIIAAYFAASFVIIFSVMGG